MCMAHFLALFHCHDLRASGSAGRWSCRTGGSGWQGQGEWTTTHSQHVQLQLSQSIQPSPKQDSTRRSTAVLPAYGPASSASPKRHSSGAAPAAVHPAGAHQGQRLDHERVQAGHPPRKLSLLVEDGGDGHVAGSRRSLI